MVKETSEIVKLTERVSKDPKSKLFVPLAEEYKKAGDLEMAVYVLTEGLKNNPGYVTARSILGRLLLEQGDLAGAQKELEEVVKVIPDNLLAQRKLGDICILQNNPNEALRYYKSVLSLNPRDNEVASIISDLEAGRDVGPKITQPKAQSTPGKAASPEVKAPPPISPAPSVQAARSGVSTTAPPASPVSRTKVPEAVPTPAPAAEKIEDPVEILLVEPLDRVKPEQESQAADFDFLSEQETTQTPLPSLEEPAELSFVAPDQSRENQPPDDLLFSEPDIVQEPKKSGRVQAGAAEKPVSAEMLETVEQKKSSAVLPEIILEEPIEKPDDFTTDTLAELYIAQGFYEKAIDIYERMLVDKPNSRGLKDKLDRVRAMAGGVSAPEEEEVKGSTDIFAEPQVYSAQKEPTGEKGKNVSSDEPVKGRSAAAERPPAGLDDAAGKFTPPPEQDFTRAKPAYTDFEPREYTPPGAKPVEAKAEDVLATSKSPTAVRKETIHRLEAWLKNIKKET